MKVSTYLLDSHVLLWAMESDSRLNSGHRDILGEQNRILVSAATIWECSIKASLGKLKVPSDLAAAVEQMGYEFLPILPAHAEAVRTLPHHHRDPFDRMLIAQAMTEGLTILTVDPAFRAYDVELA